MNVPDRIAQALLAILTRITVEKLLIVIDVARNHIEMQPLRGSRIAVHEQRERFRRGVTQPFVDGEAVAFRLGNLLALVVEKQFVDVMLRRNASENFADLVVDRRVGLVVLAEHLEIDAERGPAHAEVGLPLQLHMAARHGQRDIATVFVGEGHGAVLRIDILHGHIQHAAGNRRDWKERDCRSPAAPRPASATLPS